MRHWWRQRDLKVLAESLAVDELFCCDFHGHCGFAHRDFTIVSLHEQTCRLRMGQAAVVAAAAITAAGITMDTGTNREIAAATKLAAEAYTIVAAMVALEGTEGGLAAAFATATAAPYAAQH